MYNMERIIITIKEIEKYKHDLSEYSIKKIFDLKDKKTFYASSMLVFTILNKIIDLGNDILVSEHVGAPQTSLDTMLLLAKAGIMNEKEAQQLNKLVAKRNDFAHFYGTIDEKNLFYLIENLHSVDSFIEKIKKRVKLK